MPDPTEVRLGEYGSALLDIQQLTARDIERLHALQARGCLRLDRVPAGWRIKADATVGILVLDHVRLVVEPKFAIPGEQLMSWLSYALRAPTPLPATARRWATGPQGYADLVAAALLEQCEQLIREGLRRDYVSRQSLEPVLRGRLDLTAQVSRRYGQLDQLHVRFFARETDTWDNRILGTALREARGLAIHPDLVRDLHALADAFPQAPTPNAALRALDRVRYTRLNARYRAAHTWAHLLLRGGGVTDLLTDEGTRADGLLLAMPALWEAVVRRLATEAVAPHGGRAVPSSGATGITVQGDLGAVSAFRPDVLLSLQGHHAAEHTLLPVDAKYKRYDRYGVGAADIHQLLTYSAGYTSKAPPRAVLIHPHLGGHSHRLLQVRGPGGMLGSIHVVGVDTAAPPPQAARWIGSALPWGDW
ncbi:PE-PGRS family protein [Streptomyces sp. NPDC005811]|uniref:McrC family protein n=1 Tax=Streptomyces sp. NPDC005811 TaxID=3154565 RepID=UPI0033F3E5A4